MIEKIEISKLKENELNKILPQLTSEQYSGLKERIRAHGYGKEPVEITSDNVLLDGHNRIRICRELGIERVPYVVIDVDDHEKYIIEKNYFRRQLNAEQQDYLRGKTYLAKKKEVGAPQENEHAAKNKCTKVVHLNTRQEIAKQYDVSEQTIVNNAKFAEAIDTIADVAPEVSHKILAREKIEVEEDREERLTKADVLELAEEIKTAPDEEKSEAEILKAAAKIRAKKRKRINDHAEIRVHEEMPPGKYKTIVIDPPWPIKKVVRDCRPNQDVFDYPVMSVEEIRSMAIGDLADGSGCHLYLWTTQKYLPDAFDILKAWGFRYVFTMTWHKNGGFQPFGLPQYNSEFVLFGKLGNLDFEDTKQFSTCFNGDRREHSRKPEAFYDLVARVSPSPRIDCFSREERKGFQQHGNEKGKFQLG